LKNIVEKYWINVVFTIVGFVILIIGSLFDQNFPKYYIVVLGALNLVLAVIARNKTDFKRFCFQEHNSEFTKTVITMSDKELQESLELVKEWLEESQGNEFTQKQKETLGKMHNQDIEIIQAEISKRVN
jgi:hypothetical protein